MRSRATKKGKVKSANARESSSETEFWPATSDTQELKQERSGKPEDNEEYVGVPKVPSTVSEYPPITKKSQWGDFAQRGITGMALLLSFLAIVAMGHVFVFCLVLALQAAMFTEISLLRRDLQKEKRVPLTGSLRWYFFLVMLFFGHGRSLHSQIGEALHSAGYDFDFVSAHEFVCFVLFSLGIVMFVMTLRKGYFRYQFGSFAWSLLTLLLVIMQTNWLSANIFNGLIWFSLPALLVIANDTTAYMCGRAFGRTKLIALSPKKTWEGFIGALFCTVVIAFVVADFFSRSQHMICPKLRFDFSAVSCDPPPEFRVTEYAVPSLKRLIGISTVSFKPVQMHAVMLAIFASLIGPFGGFFASGIKRAIKKKDFGDILPGHGGVTDRFDCQILMAAFTFFYYRMFVHAQPTSRVWDAVLALPLDVQVDLFNRLGERLRAVGALE
eukprot:c2614_g1_i1.p1 GENE.c2614_g1_i1~~c2614_g1_i1.p1  ORF type:complete len:441 (-),score=104.80 c2614_g1_i1:93-1415(-)